jgi:hypothetical protein
VDGLRPLSSEFVKLHQDRQAMIVGEIVYGFLLLHSQEVLQGHLHPSVFFINQHNHVLVRGFGLPFVRLQGTDTLRDATGEAKCQVYALALMLLELSGAVTIVNFLRPPVLPLIATLSGSNPRNAKHEKVRESPRDPDRVVETADADGRIVAGDSGYGTRSSGS